MTTNKFFSCMFQCTTLKTQLSKSALRQVNFFSMQKFRPTLKKKNQNIKSPKIFCSLGFSRVLWLTICTKMEALFLIVLFSQASLPISLSPFLPLSSPFSLERLIAVINLVSKHGIRSLSLKARQRETTKISEKANFKFTSGNFFHGKKFIVWLAHWLLRGVFELMWTLFEQNLFERTIIGNDYYYKFPLPPLPKLFKIMK